MNTAHVNSKASVMEIYINKYNKMRKLLHTYRKINVKKSYKVMKQT